MRQNLHFTARVEAIDVIDEDWWRRARLTKQELQADGKVIRIVHQGDRFGRLKGALGIG